MPPQAWVPLLAVLALAAVDLWVYSDAQKQLAQGRPVVFESGSFAVRTPTAWAIGVLLLLVCFLPLYLTSRR